MHYTAHSIYGTYRKDFVEQVGRISNKTKVNVNVHMGQVFFLRLETGTIEDYVNEHIWLRGQFPFLTILRFLLNSGNRVLLDRTKF